MFFTALLFHQYQPVQLWSTDTVDEILSRGDSLFQSTFQHQLIPDAESFSVHDLANLIHWFSNQLIVYLPSEANKLNSNLPNEANETSELPSEVNRLNYNLPNEANETSELPNKVNKLNSYLPNKVNEASKLPTEAHNNLPNNGKKELNNFSSTTNKEAVNNQHWFISYEKEYQGSVDTVCVVDTPFFTLIGSALMNTFSVCDYAILVLSVSIF